MSMNPFDLTGIAGNVVESIEENEESVYQDNGVIQVNDQPYIDALSSIGLDVEKVRELQSVDASYRVGLLGYGASCALEQFSNDSKIDHVDLEGAMGDDVHSIRYYRDGTTETVTRVAYPDDDGDYVALRDAIIELFTGEDENTDDNDD